MTRQEGTVAALGLDIGAFHEALRATGDILYVWDMATDKLVLAGNVEPLFGPGSLSIPRTGEAFAQRIENEDRSVRIKALASHIAQSRVYDCEYRIVPTGGRPLWVHDRGSVEFDAAGDPSRMVGTLRLFVARRGLDSDRQAIVETSRAGAPMAGIGPALQTAIAEARLANRAGTFFVVGIDRLSMMNTAYGVESGNAILEGVERRLRESAGEGAIVERLGGDRFAIIARADAAESGILAEDMLQAVRDLAFETSSGRLHATVSIGSAGFSRATKLAAPEIMARADGALHQAKRSGRDCHVTFHLTEEERLLRRSTIDLGEQIRQSLRAARLIFAFQPVVDGRTGSVAHYECLLRMRGAAGGNQLVPAGVFMPVVEEIGMTRLVDHYVLDLAIRELALDPSVALALNISGRTATDRSWRDSLVRRLAGRYSMARRLIVEITETAALEDIEETQRFIQAVRDVGARVALDDFGAGYTSFRQLKNLTVDSVKIDGSFIRNLPNHADNQLFVRNLVSIAEAFSLEAVAECVETPEEAAMLMDLGVPLMQGWHFGRPSLERPWRTANRGSTFTKQILADLSWNRPANDKPASPPARPDRSRASS